MKKNLLIVIVSIFILSLCSSKQLNAQTLEKIDKHSFFIDLYGGTQVSGIRKMDYIASNFAPYFQVGIGKWIVPCLALSINYDGPYFHLLGHKDKHYYHYINGELIANFSNFLKIDSKYFNLYGIVGSGLFINKFKNQNNICAVLGLVNEFILNEGWSIKIKSTTIMGWDIYQGDEDAVTNYSIGVSKQF